MIAERLKVGSDEITLHVTSESSDGALVACDVTIPPGGGPPGMHRHPSAEVYRGEEGVLAVYVEDGAGVVQRIALTPGVTVHIPGGRPHTVRNESPFEARAYVTFVPGSEMEQFVRAVASQPHDVVALAERHGIEFTGPLPE
jgi:oxalate decarboxylase/phosphoglucose isomerase-like protein (cupin superfamily)